MTLPAEKKKEIIEEYGEHSEDTGSAGVQIALLTHRINDLTDHLKDHPKDHHSRQGLLKMVGKRRQLMKYLSKKDNEKFNKLCNELNIRIGKKQNL